MSLTFIAVLAILAFAGFGTATDLMTCSLRLKLDEKFLISLLADQDFHGFARTDSSGYAVIDVPGEENVFIPIHMSLFAFKEVRVGDSGDVHLYNKTYSDTVGNFFVA